MAYLSFEHKGCSVPYRGYGDVVFEIDEDGSFALSEDRGIDQDNYDISWDIEFNPTDDELVEIWLFLGEIIALKEAEKLAEKKEV